MGQQWKAVFRETSPNKSTCCKIRNIRDVQYSPVGREVQIINEITKIKLPHPCKIVIFETMCFLNNLNLFLFQQIPSKNNMAGKGDC